MALSSPTHPTAADTDYVFIAYSHADGAFVGRLVTDLEAGGIATWIDRHGLQAGMPNWERVVREAIEHSFAVVVVASPAALLSDDVHGELGIARSRARLVFPVWAHGEVWEDCIPVSLIKTQHIDCRGERYTDGISQLIADLRRKRPGDNVDLAIAGTPIRHAQPTSLMIIAPPGVASASPLDARTGEDNAAPFAEFLDALETAGSCRCTLKRASRLADISHLVQGGDCEIVQFLGFHFSSESSLTAPPGDSGQTAIHTSSLAKLLVDCLPPTVRILMLLAPELPRPQVRDFVPCAPYVVFAESSIDDGSAQAFAAQFFRSYAEDQSVERAFREAQLRLSEGLRPGERTAWLDKRARYNAAGSLLIDARVSGFPDVLTINLGPVQHSLEPLGLPRDTLVDMLARKIRAHRTAFDVPRDHAILPIDAMLHGEFSWDASAGSVTCHKLFRFRDDIDLTQWREWCRLLVSYNDLCSERFRHVHHPGNPTERGAITTALYRYEAKFRELESSVLALEEIGLRRPRLAYVAGLAYLELAREKVIEQEWGSAVVQLDFALSRLHDAVMHAMPPTA